MAREAAKHAPEALLVLLELMRTASRESVRKDAAMAVMALALQDDEEGGSLGGEVISLVEGDAVEEAKRRLRGG